MIEDRNALLRLAGGGAVALALVLGGVVIGAHIWPRVVRVEERVIAPAVKAADGYRGIDMLPDLVANACPAIVAVVPSLPPPPAGSRSSRHKPVAATGSDGPPSRLAGFLVSADGYLVTAGRDLPSQGAISILLNDGRTLDAARAGYDPISGLSLLKVEGAGFPFLNFADPDLPKVGQWGIALASPYGSGCIAQASMVSADFMAGQAGLRSFVRMSPALDGTLDGAPVLNADGKVIGMAGLGAAAGESEDASLLLPAGVAQRITSEMLRNGGTAANRFGIVADDLAPALAARLGAGQQTGAVVSLVGEGSPADEAGLLAGDIVLSVAGVPVSGASELGRALDTGDKSIDLEVLRRTKQVHIVLKG